MRIKVFFILSLLIHLLFFGGVFYWAGCPFKPPAQDLAVLEVLEPSPFPLKAGSKLKVSPVNSQTNKKSPAPKTVPVMASSQEESPSPPSEPESAEDSASPQGGDKFLEAVNVGVVTQPPIVLEERRIAYPELAKRAGVEGLVELKLVIDQQGRVQQADLIRGPGYGLDEAALKAIREFKFSPAKIGDQKVAVRIIYKYRFQINR